MKLAGKVTLITGAGSGIGQSIAITLAKEGSDVVVNDIDLRKAKETCSIIRNESGRKAIAFKADVSDAEEVSEMIVKAMSDFGKIDILVNNAGIPDQFKVPTIEQNISEWDRVVAILLRGTYLCSKRIGQLMIKQNGGVILNIASIYGIGPIPKHAAYAPAKAGIISLTALLAVEWATYNVRVNSIAPGYIWTPMTEEVVRDGKLTGESLVRRVPLGRLGKPEDIAKAAVFLVSDDANFITGVTLPVDGGWLANRL